jgi:ubiquinone/menaquinone biosynthesis C-methylase UbiE
MADWAREYFEKGYLQRWALSEPSELTRKDVESLWARLRLGSGAPLLDVACGHGRHAVVFRQMGAAVTGLDLTAALLERARGFARTLSVQVHWVRGDMRGLPFRSRHFRAAILFDALGFFEHERENLAALREAVRTLALGGRLALKVSNAEPILSGFRPTDCERHQGTIVEISRELTLNPPRLTERLVIGGPDGGGRYERRQFLYRLDDISTMVRDAGLQVEMVLPSATGGTFDPKSSPTILLVCERTT